MTTPYRLRPLGDNDLETVRTWRNRPEVRENMYTRHVISREEHEAYFARALVDPTKQYLVCEDAHGTPVGVVNFKEIDPDSKTATWAFYSGDTSQRGIGSWMEYLALEHAFTSLTLEKLSCEVLEWNDPVVRFHLKHGFRQEGVFRRHHVKDGRRYDIHRLAIFHDDWALLRSDILARLTGPRNAEGFAVGHRNTTRVDLPATTSTSGLLAAIIDALEISTIGSATRINRLEATRSQDQTPTRGAELTTHVIRLVGDAATVVFELGTGPDRMLHGVAELTISRDRA